MLISFDLRLCFRLCRLLVFPCGGSFHKITTVQPHYNAHHYNAFFNVTLLCQGSQNECLTIHLLAHLSRRLTGEFIVYPCSGVRPSVRRPSLVHNFKDLLLRNCLANQSQTSCGASLGRGNESLCKWSRSHDRDGHHGYK